MKKFISIIVAFIISLLTIIPPLDLSINFTNSPIRFVWTFLFCGFLTFYFIFSKANIWLKILLPYLFLNTFLSRIPHMSMSSFIWVTVSAYFYLLCLKIEDWQPIRRAVLCILALELTLLVLKIYHKETLLNFGSLSTNCFGSVGNGMQFKSLIIILAALLIQNLKFGKRTLFCCHILLAAISLSYFFINDVGSKFIYARGPVWLNTIILSLKHPFVGYGIGTYKAIFPALARGHFELEGVWTNPHNAFLEVLFEAGAIGFLIVSGYAVYILRKIKGFILLGSLLIIFTLCVHFPIIQNSTALLLVLFLARCEQKIKEAVKCEKDLQ